MHPAISVIFFTVASGAGYGLIALLALSSLITIDAMPTRGVVLSGGIAALCAITAGFVSSTFHLANPRNAWRAMSRFRTSWLAREGLLAVLFYPIAALWLLRWWLGYDDSVITQALAVLTVLWAMATVFSTGMIYACLRTIPQWNTSLTPANYLLLGLMLGSLALTSLRLYWGEPVSRMLVVNIGFLATAGIMKFLYFFWVGTPSGPTVNTATSFNRATVRLFDVGHSAGTFLTQEFGYQPPMPRIRVLRMTVYVLGFIVPAVLVAMGGEFNELMVAALISLAGVFVERWLFFAEARHVVTLYHGRQQV